MSLIFFDYIIFSVWRPIFLTKKIGSTTNVYKKQYAVKERLLWIFKMLVIDVVIRNHKKILTDHFKTAFITQASLSLNEFSFNRKQNRHLIFISNGTKWNKKSYENCFINLTLAEKQLWIIRRREIRIEVFRSNSNELKKFSCNVLYWTIERFVEFEWIVKKLTNFGVNLFFSRLSLYSQYCLLREIGQ